MFASIVWASVIEESHKSAPCVPSPSGTSRVRKSLDPVKTARRMASSTSVRPESGWSFTSDHRQSSPTLCTEAIWSVS